MTWSVNEKEGFATGPLEEMTRDGVDVTVSALWTAEAGVVVDVETDGRLIPAALALDVAAAMVRLANLPAPGASAN